MGEAMAAGVAVPAGPSGLQCERHHPPVPPGADGGFCLHLLDTLAEEVQGIALCATGLPQVRQKLELLAERRMPVVTFNSDIAGARRLCYVGRTPTTPAGVAGDIARQFLRPGDRILLVYADHGRGPADGAVWWTGGSGRRTAGWQRPTTTMR